MPKKKKKVPVRTSKQEAHLKDFFDMISPSTMQFNTDHFICGDTYRCVWAVREYPPQTSDQAILSRFGDRENVTLHIYSRFVDNMEQLRQWMNELAAVLDEYSANLNKAGANYEDADVTAAKNFG